MTTLGPRDYRVLVLDNEDSVHQHAYEELRGHDGIELVRALSVAEASSIVEDRFIDAAFVDLVIGSESGIDFMRHLTRAAPRCVIFVITAFTDEMAGDVLELIGAGANIRGISNKIGNANRWFVPLLLPLVEEWQSSRVGVVGLRGAAGVVAAVQEKRLRIDEDLDRSPMNRLRLRASDDAIADEIVALMEMIFGDTRTSESDHPTVSLRVLRKGYSSSVVVEAVPALPVSGLGRSVDGNRCVIKIGPRSEIATEASRYRSVVRFGVAMDYRVELLGTALGDALGAICYSFGGSPTGRLQSLDDVLRGGAAYDEVQQSILSEMFAEETSNWYSVRGVAQALKVYFNEEYHAPLPRCFKQMDQWLRKLVARNVGFFEISERDGIEPDTRRSWSMKVGEKYDLWIPRRPILADGGLNGSTPGSLIHGDLHGGNILVDLTGSPARFKFIDYRNSGFGPRMLDIAALEATVRFAHADELARSWKASNETEQAMAAICKESLSEERALVRNNSRRQASWADASRRLRTAQAVNFPDAAPEEVLWSSFAYCLALFRIPELEWHRRFRILVWLSAVTERIEYLRPTDAAR